MSALRALTSAAPLKQGPVGHAAQERPNSPRSHERGPIEAGSKRARRRTFAGSLRALTSAAPLKQIFLAVTRRKFGGSPRSHERGPIEARSSASSPPSPPSLSALSRARPH